MAPKRQKTIEEQYQKLSQLEHILLRPDSYVGSIEKQQEKLWIYDEKNEQMVQKDLTYVPGLYKIFDEILVNALDNFARDPANMTYCKVTIDDKDGCISVQNNGQSVPCDMHQEHKMYVPEMIFGHLLTSDNYDDDEKKTTGGRNGYGAKLTNIFSTKFEVECADGSTKKMYQQTWEGNMKNKEKPKITAHKGESFTKITFWPDLARFGMKKLDKDIVGLMSRRVLDAAGTTPKTCKVSLNGKNLGVNDFKDYVDLYLGDGDGAPESVHEKCSDRWEISAACSEGQFQQVSFVNSIATIKGGTHVQHVADQLVEAILRRVASKNKGGMDIKPYQVRNYLWVFVNCKIENPTFDSQTKETMTLKQVKFGSKCEVSDAFINKFLKTGIVDMVLRWAKAKEEIDLGKTLKGTTGNKQAKRLLSIPKLDDANLAGGKDGHLCTLILTEGDSAKSLAVAGLSIIGRDKYGIFPLRGKLLNVRDASFNQTMGNAEISNITKILGIEPKRDYPSARSLRYGHVMVMADQDYDGSHIKGLILNLIQHWWPSLFQLPGFVQEFVTPIVKVTRGGVSQQFFTLGEYENWKDNTNNGKGWKTKYYKGLGTSTTQEAKEYFRSIEKHSLDFEFTDEKDNEAIDLAFNKKRADDRKEWINACDDDDYVDHSLAKLEYSDFVSKELVHFAKYDVQRSIPSLVDGFKPVQRKVMWGAFKRNLKTDMKVAQLAGFVSEHAAYHHGETSLQGTIVGLAQNFVGSNNVNVLTPSGQFGTRLQGGKDQASARYIYTRLEKMARLVFHPDDDKLLSYLEDEGQSIEPSWYIPVLPLLLVNGADGIGTGWATFLPNYNPREIIENLKRYIYCQPMEDMCPWYRGFRGSIVPSSEKASYDTCGVVIKRGPTTLEITELPVKKWTQDYKEFLQGLLPQDGTGSGQIEDFKEYHTEVTVHFVITLTEEQMKKMESGGLEKSLKLRTTISVNNMVFFNRDGKINKYANERELMQDFAELRLEYYHKRKAYLLRVLRQQHEILSEKARFIMMVIEEKIKVKNRKKEALIEDLKKHKFRPLHEITEGDELTIEGEASGDKKKPAGGWEYLLGMPLWSLTRERVENLEKQVAQKKAEMVKLRATAPEETWMADLDAILDELEDLEARAGSSADQETAMRAGALKRANSAALLAGQKKRKGAAGALPGATVALPTASDGGARQKQELQQRQLSRTLAEFPGLFDELVPEGPLKPPKRDRGGSSGALEKAEDQAEEQVEEQVEDAPEVSAAKRAKGA